MTDDLLTRLARKWAEKFFTEHPSPDAVWFIREALIPMLSEYIAAAVREALEEVEKAAEHLRYCELAGSELEHRCERCGEAIAALREGRDARLGRLPD